MVIEKAASGFVFLILMLCSIRYQRTEGAVANEGRLHCFGKCSDEVKCSKICKKNGLDSTTAKIMLNESGGTKCCCVIIHEENFQGLLEALSAPVMSASPGMWMPPPPNWVKFNFDVSLGTVDSVVAVVARDSTSMPVLIFSKVVQAVEPVVMVHALKCAITLALDHGYQRAIFEVEASPVFKNMCTCEANCTRSAHLTLEDCANMLQLFDLWVVSLIPKQINYLAHNVAEWCRNASVFYLVSLDVIPASVISDVSPWLP